MIHVDATSSHPETDIKQVEFNTIASSFGGLSCQVSGLHRSAFAHHNNASGVDTFLVDISCPLEPIPPIGSSNQMPSHQIQAAHPSP